VSRSASLGLGGRGPRAFWYPDPRSVFVNFTSGRWVRAWRAPPHRRSTPLGNPARLELARGPCRGRSDDRMGKNASPGGMEYEEATRLCRLGRVPVGPLLGPLLAFGGFPDALA
jgi:hypothetical protein